MRVVKAELSQPILLGRQGEHGVTQVVFDLSWYIKTYGDGVAQLTVKRPGDPLEYMGVLTQTGTTAVWEIGPEWTEISGQGYCYLHWHVDNDHAKPSTYKTMVQESNSACDAPEPQVGYLDQIATAGARAVRAAESAEKSEREVIATARRFDETFSGVVQTAEKNAVDAAGRAEEAAGDVQVLAQNAERSAVRADEAMVGAQAAAGIAQGSAETAAASEQGAAEHRAAAEAAREQAEGYSSHPPMIGENGNWWEWDGAAYADTGKNSRGEQGIPGENGEDGYTPQKGVDYFTQEDMQEVIGQAESKFNNLYANALKGTANGAAVRLDDVSPLEHSVPVKVRRKNLVDVVTVLPEQATAMGITMTRVGDQITLNGAATSAGTALRTPFHTMGEVGEAYTLSMKYISGSITTGEVSLCVGKSNKPTGNMTAWLATTPQAGVLEGVPMTKVLDEQYMGSTWFLLYEGVVLDNFTFTLQLEKGTTATVHTPYVPDLSAVAVRQYGKNLVDADKMLNSNLTKDENGVYRITRSNAAPFMFDTPIPANTPIVLTYENLDGYNANSDALFSHSVYFADETVASGNWVGVSANFGNSLFINSTKPVSGFLLVTHNPSDDFYATFTGVQVEIGTAATEYEPYKEPIVYTADENGNVDGIISNGENMTLIANDGVVIECEYNKDINKAFEQLTQAIISMGGNI